MAINLTSDSFRIFIEDPDGIISDIAWETLDGLSMQGEPIRTSNGKQRYMIPTRPEPQPITLTRPSNVEDDRRIWQWFSNYCADSPLIDGINSGAILQVIPLRPCSNAEPYAFTAKAYDIIPTSTSLFQNIDIKNITDTATTSLTVVPREIDFS